MSNRFVLNTVSYHGNGAIREIARAMGVAGVDAMSREEYTDAAIKAVRQLM